MTTTNSVTYTGRLLGTVRITAFRPVGGSRADGYFDVRFQDIGMEINNFRRREVKGEVIIDVPTRPREAGGKWFEYPLLRFASAKARGEFVAAAESAFNEYFGGESEQPANLDGLFGPE